jgi:hypothetical protein
MKILSLSTRIILLFSFFLSATHSFSQTETHKNPKYVKYLDFRFENGAMLGNGSEIGDQLAEASYYNGLDLRLGFRLNDTNSQYSTVYRRPIFGLGWYSSTFHQEAIGKPNALYFFLTIPFKFEQAKRWTFGYTGAFGLSYNFNPYDPIENPTNVFIGSYRNCYVHLGVLANYHFSDHWSANATLGFKHFSNGSFKQPNFGINLVPFTLGVSYKLNKADIHQYKTSIRPFIKYNLINVDVFAGSKNYVAGDPNYLKAGVSVAALRKINYKYSLGIGVDAFYAAESQLRNTSDASNFSKSMSFAVVGTWEWHLTEHLYVPIGLALYLHRNPENDEQKSYYERIGIRYRFKNNMYTGVTIKAHQGVADIFEWTIGYTFQKDPNKY